MRAKFHQAECSGSRVIVVAKKTPRKKTNSFATAWTVIIGPASKLVLKLILFLIIHCSREHCVYGMVKHYNSLLKIFRIR